MPKPQRDRLLQRGVWLLVVGVFTSWLFGLGLLFIFAAAVCGFVGLFREQILRSALLLVSSLVLGVICFHIAAIVGLYVFTMLRPTPTSEAAHISTSPVKRIKGK